MYIVRLNLSALFLEIAKLALQNYFQIRKAAVIIKLVLLGCGMQCLHLYRKKSI
jgi:hypothetical protein